MSVMHNAESRLDPLVIYICSAARCGSTLTDMFLGGHSQIASLGELNFLGKAIAMNENCSCGAKVSECAHWADVFSELKKSVGIDILREPYRYQLWDARAYNLIDTNHQTRAKLAAMWARRVWMVARERLPGSVRDLCPIPRSFAKAITNKFQLIDLVATCWGKKVLIDSSKNAREAIELYKSDPAKVKIILLTRDGRGVYLSRRSSGRGRYESVRGWLNYYRHVPPLLDKHVSPDSIFRLRYEDLAGNPEEVGRRLCNFAGLNFEPAMLDLTATVRHMVNGNDTRFTPKKGIKLDERWRRELVGEELEYFERKGGAMNRRLGYV